MTIEELNTWYEWIIALRNGWHISDHDKKELIRLNHLVMEECHKIHNDNMLKIK